MTEDDLTRLRAMLAIANRADARTHVTFHFSQGDAKALAAALEEIERPRNRAPMTSKQAYELLCALEGVRGACLPIEHEDLCIRMEEIVKKAFLEINA